MYLIIAIGMMVTGGMFLFKAGRKSTEIENDSMRSYDISKLIEMKRKQIRSLRKMGFLSIVLGAALMAVYFIYMS